MELEAVVTQQDLVELMKELLPLKVYLGPPEEPSAGGASPERDRWLQLEPATEVNLVAGQGLRVTCSALLRWAIAGMGPTLTIDPLRVMLRPQVVERAGALVLEFGLEIEKADFRVLPAFMDATIADAVSGALASRKLRWNFGKTLTRQVGLGGAFDAGKALDIAVADARLSIGADALSLVVAFEIGVRS